jgi:hypothetical protein
MHATRSNIPPCPQTPSELALKVAEPTTQQGAITAQATSAAMQPDVQRVLLTLWNRAFQASQATTAAEHTAPCSAPQATSASAAAAVLAQLLIGVAPKAPAAATTPSLQTTPQSAASADVSISASASADSHCDTLTHCELQVVHALQALSTAQERPPCAASAGMTTGLLQPVAPAAMPNRRSRSPSAEAATRAQDEPLSKQHRPAEPAAPLPSSAAMSHPQHAPPAKDWEACVSPPAAQSPPVPGKTTEEPALSGSPPHTTLPQSPSSSPQPVVATSPGGHKSIPASKGPGPHTPPSNRPSDNILAWALFAARAAAAGHPQPTLPPLLRGECPRRPLRSIPRREFDAESVKDIPKTGPFSKLNLGMLDIIQGTRRWSSTEETRRAEKAVEPSLATHSATAGELHGRQDSRTADAELGWKVGAGPERRGTAAAGGGPAANTPLFRPPSHPPLGPAHQQPHAKGASAMQPCTLHVHPHMGAAHPYLGNDSVQCANAALPYDAAPYSRRLEGAPMSGGGTLPALHVSTGAPATMAPLLPALAQSQLAMLINNAATMQTPAPVSVGNLLALLQRHCGPGWTLPSAALQQAPNDGHAASYQSRALLESILLQRGLAGRGNNGQ